MQSQQRARSEPAECIQFYSQRHAASSGSWIGNRHCSIILIIFLISLFLLLLLVRLTQLLNMESVLELASSDLTILTIQSRAAPAMVSSAITFLSSRLLSATSPNEAKAGAGRGVARGTAPLPQARNCWAARCAAAHQASSGMSSAPLSRLRAQKARTTA